MDMLKLNEYIKSLTSEDRDNLTTLLALKDEAEVERMLAEARTLGNQRTIEFMEAALSLKVVMRLQDRLNELAKMKTWDDTP